MFATPGVNIGLFCSTPMVAVSRKIHRKRMMKMLLTGEPIKANFAKEIGLINDCFSKQKLDKEVLKVAKTIAMVFATFKTSLSNFCFEKQSLIKPISFAKFAFIGSPVRSIFIILFL